MKINEAKNKISKILNDGPTRPRSAVRESQEHVVSELVTKLEELENAALSKMTKVSGNDLRTMLGMDPRAGSVYVCADGLASKDSYYSGLNYVAEEYTFKLARYTFYSKDDSRVANHIDQFLTSGPSDGG